MESAARPAPLSGVHEALRRRSAPPAAANALAASSPKSVPRALRLCSEGASSVMAAASPVSVSSRQPHTSSVSTCGAAGLAWGGCG